MVKWKVGEGAGLEVLRVVVGVGSVEAAEALPREVSAGVGFLVLGLPMLGVVGLLVLLLVGVVLLLVGVGVLLDLLEMLFEVVTWSSSEAGWGANLSKRLDRHLSQSPWRMTDVYFRDRWRTVAENQCSICS